MKIHALAIIAALALPALALADEKQPAPNTSDKNTEKPAKLSEGDIAIIAHLHHINQTEIEAGKLAKKNATGNAKTYAEMLVNDHQNNDKDLSALAKRYGHHALPTQKPRTEAEKQEQKAASAEISHLKTLKGAEFDQQFANMQVADHDQAIAWIDAAIGNAQNPDLKALLTSTKAVLQRHAEEARNLQKNPPQPPSNK